MERLQLLLLCACYKVSEVVTKRSNIEAGENMKSQKISNIIGNHASIIVKFNIIIITKKFQAFK